MHRSLLHAPSPFHTTYDGDGRRVKKRAYTNNVLTEETIFVYDAAGKLIAEYSNQVASSQHAKVAYLTNDHLGSPRINTDANGNVSARHDYHPFGEEIATPQRHSDLGYRDDTVRKQFTGYEKDPESNLDFAQTRTYSNSLGRFIGPDPVGPDVFAPQTLNLYTYVLNNPLKYVDRDGRYEEEVHRDLTMVLALVAGFSPRQAWAIGNANQHIDENPETNPEKLTNVAARAEWHFTTSTTRMRHWRTFESHVRAGSEDVYSALGSFLHPQQDSFSHEGFNAVTGQASSGFGNGIPNSRKEFYEEARKVDQTTFNPEKAERMAADTLSRLLHAKAMMERSGRFRGAFPVRAPTPNSLIKPYIERWARTDGRHAKARVLAEMFRAYTQYQINWWQREFERRRKKRPRL